MIQEQDSNDSDNSMQLNRLLWVIIEVDTLSQFEGRSLSNQPPSEIFLTFWIVDLVFYLLTVYTCDGWARPYTFLW